MKPQMDLNGKGKWAHFWGDKVKAKFKKVFSKSARQQAKKDIEKNLSEDLVLSKEQRTFDKE
jgi:hypothetical protein